MTCPRAQFKIQEGMVSFKLLFTTTPVAQAAILSGSPEWVADIDRSSDIHAIENTKVRLLQVDVAVKDSRSSCGGWIFGTFHYDSAVSAMNPWRKLRPLALVWGNDPALTPASGTAPKESWVNPELPIVTYRTNPPAGSTPPKVIGWAGRGNGPVDNSLSSCLSCHMTAQIPAKSPMVPPNNITDAERLRWFRNLSAGTTFDSGTKTLDFSLQLGVGIQNFQAAHPHLADVGPAHAMKIFLKAGEKPDDSWKAKLPQQYRFGRDVEE